MKNRMFTWLLSIAILVFAVPSFAAEASEDKVSTSVTIKNNWVSPEAGDSLNTQGLDIYWSYGQLGGGVDLCYASKSNFTQIKPYLTFNKGPWYLVGGFSVDNTAEFAQAGFWFVDSFSDFNVFLDVRNYFAIDGESDDFLDTYLGISHALGGKFYVGADLICDYWWKNGDSWYLVGPLVGYKFTKSLSVFTRLSREWLISDSETSASDCVRLGLNLRF